MIILGVDPGARQTGLTVANTAERECLDAWTIDRADALMVRNLCEGPDLLPVPRIYLTAVTDALRQIIDGRAGLVVKVDAVAVETVTKPNWHVHSANGRGRAAANPEALLACAQVLGAVLALKIDVPIVQVPPGHNGSSPLAAYPDNLVSDAERRSAGWRMKVGGGVLRHARSAYDVALQAPLLLRSRT